MSGWDNLNPDEFQVNPKDAPAWASQSHTVGWSQKRRMGAIASGSRHCAGKECEALVGGTSIADPSKYMNPQSGDIQEYCPTCSTVARQSGMIQMPLTDPAVEMRAHIEDFLNEKGW